MSKSARTDPFRGLANAARRRVLAALADGEKTPAQLLRGLKFSSAALSQHLRILSESGLVAFRRAGAQRYYRVNAANLRKASRWLAKLS